MSEASIVIIDICGTIYNSNTTFDFLDYFFKENKFYHYSRSLLSCQLFKILNILFLRLFKFDFCRHLLIRFLSGHSKIEIERKTKSFIFELLEKKRQEEVIKIIMRISIPENKLILVSATLDCIALEIAKKFNIDSYFASELEYLNGICTGRIKVDLLGNKLKKLRQNGIYSPFKVVISDNFSDTLLMNKSGYSYIVVSEKKRKRWNKILKTSRFENFEIVCVE
jgi:phosphoserine phosphatase